MATQDITRHNADSQGQADSLSDMVSTASDGILTTTSLIVAEKFGKDHKNVLRAIRNLECSDEFSRLNFEPIDFIDKNGEAQPAVKMTRDGFTFLAMGFTGKAAAGWKEKFIAAFNRMEQELRNRQTWAMPPELVQAHHEMLRSVAHLGEFSVSANTRLDHHETVLGEHGASIDEVRNAVAELARQAKEGRLKFGAETVCKWNGVVWHFYGGKCPCCQKTRILDKYGRPISGVYEKDHWKGRGSNAIHEGWPVCKDCNRGILQIDRDSRAHAFLNFHRLRKDLFSAANLECKQLSLIFEGNEAA